MSGLHVHPDHMRRSGGKLSEFGGKIAEGGQKLESAGQQLVSHASGDRSGVGAVVAKAMGKGVEVTGKVFEEGGRVAGEAGRRLHTSADLYEEADAKGASLLKKHHPDVKGDIDPHGGGASRARPVGGGGGGGRSARQHLDDDPRGHAVGENQRTKSKDPVDLATGEVLLPQTDLELPGALPLVLSRTHLSSYRVGRSFGQTWATTVDQRLEIDADGAVFVAADGVLLVYPTPTADDVLPVEGARWPLRRTDIGYTITKPEAGQSLLFDSSGALVAIADRAGHRIDFDRTTGGTLTEIRHSGGYRVAVDTVDGLITGLSVAGQPFVRFAYESRQLTEVIDAAGHSLRFSYDADGRLTEWVDRNDMWYRYHYDSGGRCVFAEGAGGQLNCTMEFDREQLVTTATDSLGHVTRYHLNEKSQVVAVVDPAGGRTASEWDRYDRLLSRTDPLGRTTRFDYTEAGDLQRVTRPDGSQVVIERNHLRLPVTQVDPDGAIWRRDFDDVGNVIAVTDPAGAVTRYEYDESRHLKSVTDPLGGLTRIECNQAGLPVVVTDPLGAVAHYERDEFGRVIAVRDPVGGVSRLEWTASGKLARCSSPDGTVESWSYDGEGNLVEHVDASGAVTRTEFAGFDRPVAEIDPTGARTVFNYDTELRLVSVTNPAGLVWRYDYDAAGNLISETDFDGRTIGYARDAAGQLIAKTNGAGQTTTFEVDALGRTVARRSEDSTATFAYDAVGRLIRATNADADVVFTRDQLGRVVQEATDGRSVVSTFDAQGHRVSRVTPAGARSLWSYDAAGRPTALTSGAQQLAFDYDPAGRQTGWRFGVAALSQTWDDNHRLRTQALVAPGPANQQRLVQRRAYTYRNDGAVTNIVDQLAGVRRFELDPLGRVTGVAAADRQERYGYDLSGNLTEPARPHTAAGTLLRAAGDTRYEHDDHGRQIARHSRTLSGQARSWRYLWNCEDRLVAVTTPDQITWRYVYDALGRRIAKLRLTPDNQVAEQTLFTWDGTTLAEQVHSSGHRTTWNHRPGSSTPVTQAEQDSIDERFYAIVTDIVGTPTELVDAAGNLAWRQNTTLWGAVLAPLQQDAYCPIRFPGQYHDLETGHHYNLYRHYDPEVGRYLSADPLGLAPAPNPRSYVGNPLLWADPVGLAPYRVFYSVQDEADARRLVENGGEPWPTGTSHGSARAEFGPGLYTWETREDAEKYLAGQQAKGADVSILEHRISEEDYGRLKSADLTKMDDDTATDIWNSGGNHGYDHVRRMTGRYGVENYFRAGVYGHFHTRRAT